MNRPSSRSIEAAGILRAMTFQELVDTAEGIIEAMGGGIYGPGGDSIDPAMFAHHINEWAGDQIAPEEKEAEQ